MLLRQLYSIGIRESALAWLTSYLSDRTLAIKIGDVVSRQQRIDCGVPPGICSWYCSLHYILHANQFNSRNLPMRGCLEHRYTILTAYNGKQIQQYGTTRLKCAYETTTCDTELFVADTPGPVILGLPTCRKLTLVTLNCAVSDDHPPLKSKEDLLRMYPDCFEGIRKFRETFHITLDPTVTPVVHAPRRCPIHIKDEANNEINQMVDLGVIEKVDEPTDWVSSIDFSRKSNGKLRI